MQENGFWTDPFQARSWAGDANVSPRSFASPNEGASNLDLLVPAGDSDTFPGVSIESKSVSSRPSGAFKCLILEDDPSFAALTSEVVRAEGGVPHHCATLREAFQAVDNQTFDILLLDNHLPDGRSYDFFHRVTRRQSESPVIMITGLPNLGEALSLTRNGLFDYLTKPVTMDALTGCLKRARQRLESTGKAVVDPQAVLGTSAGMRDVLNQLRQAAQHPGATVLLTGESGVGKDVAARTLHRLTHGQRADESPYVAINCAAVPADMFEAELFGAERGAYTGAERKRIGLAASAQGGTLFLDELGEVPLPMQAKLLRFLEGREFRALGGTEVQQFDGRFIAATNKSLQAEVEAGRFREDLLFRIQVLVIEIPPLRERREDIPALCAHLLASLGARYGRTLPHLKREDVELLQAYAFPGNVRELRNILERSLLRTPRDSHWLAIDPGWLVPPSSSGGKGATVSGASKGMPPAATAPAPSESFVSAAPPVPPPAVAAPLASAQPDTEPLPPERTQLTPLEQQEYRMIRQALKECRGGIRKSAARVGLSPQALLRRLEKWPELRESNPETTP